jgi:small subunit ribosomal protein S17
VLIKELPEKITTLITHKIEEIVFPLGDVTDPVTGKKCVVSKYREQIDEEMELYGKNPNAFDYKKAPPRGRLEGKKDFTHGTTYIKYHDSEEDQPFGV